ncbi:MAG: MscS family rane protein, partial [Blastocatellia bacterium]|nr:MscS family rane protein [Blastocatellia bacterium]
ALLRVELGNLLVGGAVTGVIVGIAAQQTLGNVFAGLVLLFARPYVPGQRVKFRSGAMGGPFDGVIVTAGLMYTIIDTDEGLVSMPNSGLLAAAIGPYDGQPEEVDGPGGTAVSGDPATGPGGNPTTGAGGNPA